MLLALLELASKRALDTDPVTQEKLQKLQGKTLALNIKAPPIMLLLTPNQEGVELSVNDIQPENQPDVTLTTTLSALIKISREGMEDAELEPGELDIAGDAIVGQRFANIIANLNIDWEELLAQQIGDSPARLASLGLNKATESLGSASDDLKALISHLLEHDLEITANQADVQNFIDSVDTLRGDADRLMARLNKLRQQLAL